MQLQFSSAGSYDVGLGSRHHHRGPNTGSSGHADERTEAAAGVRTTGTSRSKSRSAYSRCSHSSLRMFSKHSRMGKALRLRVARLHDRFGHAGQLLVGEIGEFRFSGFSSPQFGQRVIR